MKKFQVVTPGHWVYAAVDGAALVALGWAVVAGDAVQVTVSTLVALSALGATAFLFRARLAYARSIVSYTKQGVAVIPSTEERWSPEHTVQVEEVVENAIDFWSREYPKQASAIRAAFDGGSLSISDDVLVNPATKIQATGLTFSGKHIRAWWAPGEDFSHLLARLKHECGHVALGAMGIYDEAENHRIMRERDYRA